jgi:hypothetical protein
MVVSISKDDLGFAISFTLEQMREQEPDNPYYASEESFKAVLFDVDKVYLEFASVPKLLWPNDRPKRPELESGQHRREALIQSFGLSLDEGHPMRTLDSSNFMASFSSAPNPWHGLIVLTLLVTENRLDGRHLRHRHH